YTTGAFAETMASDPIDFDPGAGTTNLSPVGSSDIFIQKLDASGNFLWAKSFGGSSSDQGNSIAVDAAGNVYTTGSFEDTVDFDPGAGTTNLSAIGGSDIFIQKLDASGNFLWAKSFGGSSSDWGSSIAVDASENVYTTGSFQDTVDFDPGAGTINLISQGSLDIFVHKINQTTTVGLVENSFDQAINIFPNPSTGTFTIDLGMTYDAPQVIVRDAVGRIVHTAAYNATSMVQISLDQPAGIYFVEIASGTKKANLKLIRK
ncbi:MAG: SBBP repeat-containing protein, partial [Saprospiraceae bacterium]|nr:SBBP repeat-containing protein [Saprospiraceae bacterium]